MTKFIISIIVIIFLATTTNAVKIYTTLNVDGNYITNVPDPVADSHIVNKRYADHVYSQNAVGITSNALPAKCAGGQISGYTPIPGEDLYANMQYGVDWIPNSRFTVDSTDSNVYDNLTGLMWTKNANILGHTTNWVNAIDFCTNLVYGGYSDWRLPNRKELFSLVDFSQDNPSLPVGHPFGAVQAYGYWSASTYANNSGYAWNVYVYNGFVYNGVKTSSYYVWPVRSGR